MYPVPGMRAHGRSLVAALVVMGFAAARAAVPGADHAVVHGPYLQNVRQTAITVCWVTGQAQKGTVSWAREQGSAPAGRRGTVSEQVAARYHRVRLDGLAPGARYTYTVSTGGDRVEGTFRTAPPPSEPFRFVVYGDNRSQPERHAAVVARIVRLAPDLVLNTGDQVASGASEPQWSGFFRVAAPLLRNAPYYPTRGNHEGDAAPYYRYFGLPRDYSFDYGNTHFVALDTTRPAAERAAQARWLQRDLAAHQDAAWRVVFCHHPLVSCTVSPSRREEAQGFRERLDPILRAGRVQLVFGGHDHNYQRHMANGITYIVTGGGGAPLYDCRADTPFVRVARKAYHACEVTVEGDRIRFRAVEPDGSVIDSFDLRAGR